jgi:drug/metabolite transporter (DMT)-like permease
MARVSLGTRLSYRSQQRRFAKSVAFPLWITIPFVLIIGLILWLGVLSDPSGKLRRPGIGSIFYVAAVIGVAAFLAYTDRNRDSAGKNRKDKRGYKRDRHATAK